MTRPMPFALLANVTDLDSGMDWIDALIEADMAFHLEDSPETIINMTTGLRLFSKADSIFIRKRVAALYRLDWGVYDCPIGYLLAQSAEVGEADYWTPGDVLEFGNGQLACVAARGTEGFERRLAILGLQSGGFMVAARDKESFAQDSWTDLAEGREEPFATFEEAARFFFDNSPRPSDARTLFDAPQARVGFPL